MSDSSWGRGGAAAALFDLHRELGTTQRGVPACKRGRARLAGGGMGGSGTRDRVPMRQLKAGRPLTHLASRSPLIAAPPLHLPGSRAAAAGHQSRATTRWRRCPPPPPPPPSHAGWRAAAPLLAAPKRAAAAAERAPRGGPPPARGLRTGRPPYCCQLPHALPALR